MKLLKARREPDKGAVFTKLVAYIEDVTSGNAEALTRFMGSPDASTLLLCPVPTDAEFTSKLFWSGESASVFFNFMAEINIGVPSFILLPPMFVRGKPVKALTSPAVTVFEELVKMPSIKRVLCIGATPFKIFVNRGATPNMSTLVGSVIRGIDSVQMKPLLVLPDLVTMPNKRLEGRDFVIAKRAVDASMQKYESLLPVVKKFMVTV